MLLHGGLDLPLNRVVQQDKFAGARFLGHGRFVRTLARRSPEVLFLVESKKPMIALTIDDGPDRETTEPILRLLEDHRAKATFFLMSNHVEGNEEVVRDIVDRGHELGNHLATDIPSIVLPRVEFERQLLQTEKVLSKFAPIRWFRPSSGLYSRAMLSVLKAHQYRCVLGSIYAFDAQIPFPDFVANFILHKAQFGSIVILHDRGKRGQRTLRTLRKVLPRLRQRGFHFATLSELTASSHRS